MIRLNNIATRRAVFVLTVFSVVSPAWAIDTVVRKSDNVSLRGRITSSDTAAILLTRTNGDEITVSVADLKSVRFEAEPSQLGPARANEASGEYATALRQLKDAKAGAGGDRRVKTEVDFLIARATGQQALQDSTKIDGAIALLQAFRTVNAANFRYLEATLLEAAVHSAGGDFEKSRSLLQEVRQSGVEGFQLQAGSALGRTLLAAGDTAGALKAFDAVIQRSAQEPSAAAARFRALLGRALCQQQQGHMNDALATLDGIIADAPSTETATLAEAWIRKGDCLVQLGKPKAALMAFLHVDILYPNEASPHAEALLKLSELWGPGGHQDRAVDASTRLAELYPNSRAARQLSGGR